MKTIKTIQLKCKKVAFCLCLITCLCFFYSSATSQITSVYTVQNMNFGVFYPRINGGNITVSTNASRSVTGDVVLLNQGSAALQTIFEIEAPSGTVVSILNGPDVSLTGSNGGTVSLRIGNSAPAAPFTTTIAPPGRTSISIGATLTIGNSATTIPGSYSGTFSITFINE